ncbi:unnamed protein product [Cyprideis torosa]|uniref:Uncharacterized protein n=1 Tax=Cyprideis torosa TaxID=163714 RepID=A0A7R8ZLU7_9CRUS|nr:unnamed protein product [Cyprideis torosa]CAG0884466.1 unnamed protein product [Cyprideis torosa]
MQTRTYECPPLPRLVLKPQQQNGRTLPRPPPRAPPPKPRRVNVPSPSDVDAEDEVSSPYDEDSPRSVADEDPSSEGSVTRRVGRPERRPLVRRLPVTASQKPVHLTTPSPEPGGPRRVGSAPRPPVPKKPTHNELLKRQEVIESLEALLAKGPPSSIGHPSEPDDSASTVLDRRKPLDDGQLVDGQLDQFVPPLPPGIIESRSHLNLATSTADADIESAKSANSYSGGGTLDRILTRNGFSQSSAKKTKDGKNGAVKNKFATVRALTGTNLASRLSKAISYSSLSFGSRPRKSVLTSSTFDLGHTVCGKKAAAEKKKKMERDALQVNSAKLLPDVLQETSSKSKANFVEFNQLQTFVLERTDVVVPQHGICLDQFRKLS